MSKLGAAAIYRSELVSRIGNRPSGSSAVSDEAGPYCANWRLSLCRFYVAAASADTSNPGGSSGCELAVA